MSDVERGVPIVKSTLCRVGVHVFTWRSTFTDAQPDPWLRCDCGMTSYGEAARPGSASA